MERQSQSPGPGSDRLPALVYFAKAPRPGLCKTRLCPPLSHEEAAVVYRDFLRTGVTDLPGLDCFCYGWPADGLDELAACLPAGMALRPQRGASLWERMANCLKERLSAGHPAVVLRNTDSPDLPERIVRDAVSACRPGRVVLGPDQGGGYYLIGLCELPEGLIEAGGAVGASVCGATAARALELGLEVVTLPEWSDVDDFADLLAYRARRGSS